ncbi:peptidoglycan D,D-transpeptidase FtsI family protein [Rubritalea sp.]|uniref:peptidoglycan D,D-transpeptidase FtsI family protein n=1 Tax=Rubritalea sp. TaxID=2109375 RepID=UPI003EF6C4B8
MPSIVVKVVLGSLLVSSVIQAQRSEGLRALEAQLNKKSEQQEDKNSEVTKPAAAPNEGDPRLTVDTKGDTEAISELDAPVHRSADQADIYTRPDARTMTLSIPALRGQILDRHGNPLAQNKVVWYPSLQYQQFANADKEFVVAWARERITKANEVFEINWEVKDEELWQHYRQRRWLPLSFTHVVEAERKELLEPKLIDGLILHPIYQRYYPQNDAAAHLIGYVGSKGKLEKGPINYGDPIFEYTEGRAGFEKLYDEELTGVPGLLKLQYDSSGAEVLREQKRAPRQGGSVVTTLDLEWQKRAESVLNEHAHRGALVIIDVRTGELVAMASLPSYDLNTFVPFISTDDYKTLRENEDSPLFARAYQAEYPPASTFKAVVALSALQNRVIDRYTEINTPAFIQLGRHQMWNWSKKPEGYMNVVKGLYRSNNPFFIQVGIATRPENIVKTAAQLGYGKKSGLPLVGERPGRLPDDAYMMKKEGRRMTDGDTANMSIGQGMLLATPLQVAQGMAGIANGGRLPKLQLVRQVQDANGRIIKYNREEPRQLLNMLPEDVVTVQEGLMRVVNDPAGTGKRAYLSYTTVSGKTGTAQWGPKEKEQNLGWFTGFFPIENPKYAFAMVYEGRPGEKVSGGSKAAPMVKSFFEPIKEDVMFRINPPVKAMIVEEDETEVLPDQDDLGLPGRAMVIEEAMELPDTPPAPRAVLVEEDLVVPEDSPRAVPVEEEVDVPDLRELPPSMRQLEEPTEQSDNNLTPSRTIIIEEGIAPRAQAVVDEDELLVVPVRPALAVPVQE